MNVLLVTMGLGIGGAETHIVELAKGLKKKQVNVIVVSNGGDYVKELEEANIKHYNAPLNNKKLNNMRKSYKILKQIIENEKIDVVHGHARIPSFICGALHKKMKFPFVTTAHWTFNTKNGLKYLTNWGEKTIAVSDDIKTYLLDNYKKVKAENITVTVNGIDTDKFSTNAKYEDILNEFNIDNNKKKIVYISRLDESRALVARQLINISEKLNEFDNNLEIVIVGGGDVFDELNQKANEVNAKVGKKLITMVGPRSDIYKFANLGDMFIGVSRSALEAMACEKPIIIAGNEGYIGIFDESKLDVGINTNFCCRDTIDSTEEILERDIKELLSQDKETSEKMGIYNREVVMKYYSLERMVSDNFNVYKQILSEKK
ncbi:MAG: glycosyltransferase family 4 protein [Clostridiales bacterium]|nr:glycosyltransferase family 4 protein [Clostridiales bacterium]